MKTLKIFKHQSFAALLMVGFLFGGCSRNSSYGGVESETAAVIEDYEEDDSYDSAIAYEEVTESPQEAAERRYKEKYDEVHIADIHLMRADGRKLWYNYLDIENEYGWSNKLYVYDSETDTENIVNLNKTSLDDDAMYVEDMKDKNGIITIIMSEMRNSNGWIEGTYVWQYNCQTGTWKAIARECSGAEFVKDGAAVRVNYAECLNPDEPTYLQKYRDHYRTIKL